MFSFYLFWCLSYVLLHSWLAKKWPPKLHWSLKAGFSGKISLLIPFRNERPNLQNLSAQVKKLIRADVEVWLVDDGSEDGSFEILSDLLADTDRVYLKKSPGTGKKAALDFGISHAQGDVILTSDADCLFPENWINNMVAGFDSPEVQLVAGPVISRVDHPGFLQRFQQIEWLSILLMTQYSFSRKQPLMCSGANLGFRKAAYREVGGYSGNEHLLSGDDEFLLKKIAGKFGPESCRYLPSREVLVITSAQPSWRDLLRQRIRWAGKWKAHRSFSHGFSAILAFLIQLVWIASWFLFYGNFYPLVFLMLIWAIKIVAETGSLRKVGIALGVHPGWLAWILGGVVHPFYVLGVGIGTFFLKVRWKGRTQ